MRSLLLVVILAVSVPANAAKVYATSTKVVNVEHDLFCSAPPKINKKAVKRKKEPVAKLTRDFYLELLKRRPSFNDRLFRELNPMSDLLGHDAVSGIPRSCLSVESTIKTASMHRENITNFAISSKIWY